MSSLRATLCAAILGVSLTACGSADEPGPASVAANAQSSSQDATTPENLAAVEPDLELVGPDLVAVTAGETVVVTHAVRNPGAGTESVGFVARTDTDRFGASPEASSLRLRGGEARSVGVEVTVPPDAQPGTTVTYALTAAVTGGQAPAVQRVELNVVDVEGSRPALANAEATTTTNQKVSVYVLGSAEDADANIDNSTLSVVFGGFLTDTTSAANGTISYLPFKDVVGIDVVIYELCDTEGLCGTATAFVAIEDSQ